MNRKGRVNYTPQEEAERKNFILQRLRSGFSRLETQRQFVQEFTCSIDTARNWYAKACAELVSPDLEERKRTHAIIVEMLHAQITAAQADLVAVQQEIAHTEKVAQRRAELTEQIIDKIIDGSDATEALEKQLFFIPDVKIDAKLNGLEIKSRMRERMFRIISELARIQGVYNMDSNWAQALHVLLDNGLLPPANAEQILATLDLFTQQIQQQQILKDNSETQL